jgi:hypothetical protein
VIQQLVPPALQPLFWQVNRSTYVNCTFITSYDTESVFCGQELIVNTRVALRDLQQLLGG